VVFYLGAGWVALEPEPLAYSPERVVQCHISHLLVTMPGILAALPCWVREWARANNQASCDRMVRRNLATTNIVTRIHEDRHGSTKTLCDRRMGMIHQSPWFLAARSNTTALEDVIVRLTDGPGEHVSGFHRTTMGLRTVDAPARLGCRKLKFSQQSISFR